MGTWAASHMFIQMIANKHGKDCKKPFAQEHFNLKSNFTMSVFFCSKECEIMVSNYIQFFSSISYYLAGQEGMKPEFHRSL